MYNSNVIDNSINSFVFEIEETGSKPFDIQHQVGSQNCFLNLASRENNCCIHYHGPFPLPKLNVQHAEKKLPKQKRNYCVQVKDIIFFFKSIDCCLLPSLQQFKWLFPYGKIFEKLLFEIRSLWSCEAKNVFKPQKTAADKLTDTSRLLIGYTADVRTPVYVHNDFKLHQINRFAALFIIMHCIIILNCFI